MDVVTFISVYDEFSDFAFAKVQYHLNRAVSHIDDEIYGTHTEEAIGLLAAHYLTLAPAKKSTPAAISALGFKAEDVKSVEITDDIVVEFNPVATQGSAVASTAVSGLDATVYGQQLEALKLSLIVPFTFA
jgi:hypothetical protein